jgi:hypothetical protein
MGSLSVYCFSGVQWAPFWWPYSCHNKTMWARLTKAFAGVPYGRPDAASATSTAVSNLVVPPGFDGGHLDWGAKRGDINGRHRATRSLARHSRYGLELLPSHMGPRRPTVAASFASWGSDLLPEAAVCDLG